MGNCSLKQSQDPQEVILPRELPSSIKRRGKHATSLQFILKKGLARWDYVKLEHNVLKMTEKDFDYDPELKRMRGGYVHDADIKPIWKEINKSIRVHRWKGIKSFDLYIHGYSVFGESGLKDLVRGISQDLPELQSLSLDSMSSKIKDHGMHNLGVVISRELAALKALNVGFHCKDTGLKLMMSQVSKYLYDLNQLPVDFSVCRSIQENNAKAIVSMVTKRLVKLTVLSLDLLDCRNLSDEGLSQIGSELTKHKLNLQSLNLRVSSLTDRVLSQGVEPLVSNVVKQFNSLKDLTLDFSFSELDYQGLQVILLNNAYYLRNLERLKLSFRGCKCMTDEGVKGIASKLIPNLTQIRELKIILAGSENITDSSIEALLSIDSKKLTHLETITLNLHLCYKITDKGVQALATYLKNNLKYFKLFRLNLHSHKPITKITLLQNFQSLPNFELLNDGYC